MAAGSDAPKPHVLFLPSFYSDPDKPIVGSFFKEQAQAVAKAGLRVGVAYVEPRRLRALRIGTLKENHGQITSGEEEGLPTIRLRGWNPHLQSVPGGLIWSLASRFLVARYIMRYGRPDVIHAQNARWAGLAAYQVWRRSGIPYVVTEHSGEFMRGEVNALSRFLVRRAYRNASEVIVVSNALGRSIGPLLGGKKFCVVPNCVDVDVFSLPPVLPPKRGFFYLAVARLSSVKGIDILLRAFAGQLRRDPSVFLRIGGDGSIRQELMSLCEQLGISQNVRFLGELSREGVKAAMWEANALVLSSFQESFGIVLIEAMSTGLPVVATRCGGPEDIVTEETGILVEPGNIEQLSEAMQRVRDSRRFPRESIRQCACGKYAQVILAATLRNIYERVSSSAGEARSGKGNSLRRSAGISRRGD